MNAISDDTIAIIANSTGELEIDYQPDSLLSPPSGFWSYSYPRRTGSTQKVVLP